MLHAHSRVVDVHATLYQNQLVDQINEILLSELEFYNSALSSIATSTSVLAGFAFNGLCMTQDDVRTINPLVNDEDDYYNLDEKKEYYKIAQTIFNSIVTATLCLCLLTLVISNFASIFSFRLALRGGGLSVEKATTSLRQEFRLILVMFVVCVIMFLLSLICLSIYKFGNDGFVITAGVSFICVLTCCGILYVFIRARSRFFLGKDAIVKLEGLIEKYEHHVSDRHETGLDESIEQKVESDVQGAKGNPRRKLSMLPTSWFR